MNMQAIMRTKHDTVLRQWQMLRHIPRYPSKITTRDLHARLSNEGFEINKRSVERDLLSLSSVFPLCLDNREKPYGWSWHKDAPAFDLPGLGNNEALTMMMVEQHLNTLLPASTLDVLKPYFRAAHQHLAAIPRSQHLRSWLNKVRTVPPTQSMLAPEIDSSVQHAVTKALLSDRQLLLHYRRRKEDASTEYRVHPLALVQRGGLVYLYVRFFDYENTRTLAMHRIESAVVLNDPSAYPPGFDIDEEIAKGRFGFGDGSMIRLKVIFSAERGEHLYETPLSADQSIEDIADGRLLVTATVADTAQLEWWLLALGDGVEVLEPLPLRQSLSEIIKRMAHIYRD